eukprot:scaffold1729_cov117-Cylindrotheca_fusiformis.AAC.8
MELFDHHFISSCLRYRVYSFGREKSRKKKNGGGVGRLADIVHEPETRKGKDLAVGSGGGWASRWSLGSRIFGWILNGASPTRCETCAHSVGPDIQQPIVHGNGF